MKSLLMLGVLLLVGIPAGAAESHITVYLDGARVETDIATAKGYAEVPLPGSMTMNSLRIRPVSGILSRVDIVPARPEQKYQSDLARLVEGKEKLLDRLQALAVREEIFKAAAKSQSGKAPRKTKSNREPLDEIRKGTEFAIAQLEGVYGARRKAKRDLQVLENQMMALGQSGTHGGSTAKIWFAGKEGRAVVSWLQPMPKWTPVYDFRLTDSNEGEMVLYAVLPKMESKAVVSVSPSSMGDARGKALVDSTPGRTKLFSSHFLSEQHRHPSLPQLLVSFKFRNNSERPLPAGEATCFTQGEFVGKTEFPGSLPDEVRELSFGFSAPLQ